MSHELVAAGAQPQGPLFPGDFILVHRTGIIPGLISLRQRLYYPAQWTRWNHAAFVAHPDGSLIEALARAGVVHSHLWDYHASDYVLVHTDLCMADRRQAVAFAQSCVGQHYGWFTDLAIAISVAPPGKGLWFGLDGTEICSGLVAQALCRGPAIFTGNPGSVMPSGLAAYYRVNPTVA